MKRLFICLLSILLVAPSLAQEETLVEGEFHSGGYGGPVWKAGLVNGKVGLYSGGRGGWIINHTGFQYHHLVPPRIWRELYVSHGCRSG